MINPFCNFFPKKHRVHSFLKKPRNGLIHPPLYSHILRHDGKIAKGATLLYKTGEIEIIMKNIIIFTVSVESLKTNDTLRDTLCNLQFIANRADFANAMNENKQCFIVNDDCEKEVFLRNIYLVKEPGFFGKKYIY